MADQEAITHSDTGAAPVRTAGTRPRRFYTPGPWITEAPGVRYSRAHEPYAFRWDTYIGTRESLAAAGLLPADLFPGQPGVSVTRATYWPHGAVGAVPTYTPGHLTVVRRPGEVFCIRIAVPATEQERRRAEIDAAAAQQADRVQQIAAAQKKESELARAREELKDIQRTPEDARLFLEGYIVGSMEYLEHWLRPKESGVYQLSSAGRSAVQAAIKAATEAICRAVSSAEFEVDKAARARRLWELQSIIRGQEDQSCDDQATALNGGTAPPAASDRLRLVACSSKGV